MPSPTLAEQWEAARLHLKRVRIWLRTPQRSHSVATLLWLIAVVVIAVLVISRASTAKDLADLISAFAALAWPVVTVAIVSSFRPEIRAILSRIRKGKFLGQEIELAELEAKTGAAEVRAELPTVSGELSASLGEFKLDATATVGPDIAQDAIEEVLREAARSPRLGLMLLSAKMERAARELAAETGLDVPRSRAPLIALIRYLLQAGQIAVVDADALILFNQVRNRIVHGQDADDDEIARAIDSGTRLLRLLLTRRRPISPELAPAG